MRARVLGLGGLVLAAGCSLSLGGRDGRGAAPLDPGLRVWVAPIVYWEAGADRHVDLAIENETTRTVKLAEPDPASARVAVYPGADDVRVCGVEPRSPRPGTHEVELAPGASLAVRVDLKEACAGVPAGEYRFEVDYRARPSEGDAGAPVTLATRYGELMVEGPPVTAAGERRPTHRAGRTPPRR